MVNQNSLNGRLTDDSACLVGGSTDGLASVMPCTNVLAQSGDPIVGVAPGLTKPIEISASRLAAYLERHPFVEPKKAVQNIVDIAFLAQSAQSKGLGDIVVLHTWYAVLAEQYLDIFEDKYTAEKPSEDKPKAVYVAKLL